MLILVDKLGLPSLAVSGDRKSEMCVTYDLINPLPGQKLIFNEL